MATQSMVKVRIGKHVPALGFDVGGEYEVTSQAAEEYRAKRWLLEQVQEDAASKRGAKEQAVKDLEEKGKSSDIEHVRAQLRNTEAKLQAERATSARLSKELGEATAALAAATKRSEESAGELSSLKEKIAIAQAAPKVKA